ncbi:MAG: sigma-70 family RNA polymerase sigma factor [Bacteroidota bacterium]|nr:sigma-70 family RNA polymerase sigma factor [Bacteroidota bacterium]
MASDNENLGHLIKQLQQGDERAFTLLYDQYSKPIYRNILRLVKDQEIAQELLQDLFLRVWERRAAIKIEGSFKSYLYKVSENLVYKHFRKIAQDNRLVEKLIASSVQYETNVEDSIVSRETIELLQKAIDNLSPQRKQIYTLCKLEGKSHEEVSKELGISTSTVNNHIVKANHAVKHFFLANTELAALLIAIHAILHKD